MVRTRADNSARKGKKLMWFSHFSVMILLRLINRFVDFVLQIASFALRGEFVPAHIRSNL